MQLENGKNPPPIMVTKLNPLLLIVMLMLIARFGSATAQESAEGMVPEDSLFNEIPGTEIDISRWKCKFCPDPAEEPWFLELESGLGYVTNDSFKFGEYNGLHEEGAFFILDVDALYRDDDANYLDIRASDLGLDSKRVDIEGGTQGEFRVNLVLDEIYRHQLDTARTPYTGSTSQQLPGNWVAGATTAAMATLDSNLEDLDFSTRRRVLSLSSRIIQNRKWSYDALFERQTREGQMPFGAAIGTTFADARSAILAKPVDYVTDRFELVANYRDNKVTGSFSYAVSAFQNNNSALRWENAFSIGSNSGQVALEPDNQMQQITAAAQYRGFKNVALNGSMMIARLTQDERFLPYTVNSGVAAPPLPRTSLDGKVDVSRADANALWTISPKSRVKLSYEYFERVDNTDRATYTYVIADNTVTGIPRANFPYSFRTQKLKGETSYKLEHDDKIAGGLEYGRHERTYQEVDQSTETRVWARYSKTALDDINYSLELEGAERKADRYEVLAEITPPENPQLRKYNLADRNTVGASFKIDFVPAQRWFVNASLDQSSADYSNSPVGLEQSDDLSIGFDLQYLLSDEISLTGYLNRAVISSNQNNSSVAGDPDWSAENSDRINTFGVGLSYEPDNKGFRLAIDYVHTDAIGEIDFSDPSLTPLPDLKSKLDNIEIRAEFEYSENLSYRASYTYEVYEEKNWNIDGVDPDTIDNVLTLGETSPDYKIGVLWLSLKYRL
jgi:MtrB/PioB family decaheme-associated outer membrane protein